MSLDVGEDLLDVVVPKANELDRSPVDRADDRAQRLDAGAGVLGRVHRERRDFVEGDRRLSRLGPLLAEALDETTLVHVEGRSLPPRAASEQPVREQGGGAARTPAQSSTRMETIPIPTTATAAIP
jgi:hypothetical protein